MNLVTFFVTSMAARDILSDSLMFGRFYDEMSNTPQNNIFENQIMLRYLEYEWEFI